MKVVLNVGAGGFSLSQKAYEWLLLMMDEPCKVYPDAYCWGVFGITKAFDGTYYDQYFWLNRTHPLLVDVVTVLGEEASEKYSLLKIIEIPDGIEFTVEQNEHGMEWVAEKHRIWS